jgi:hypothetical protein
MGASAIIILPRRQQSHCVILEAALSDNQVNSELWDKLWVVVSDAWTTMTHGIFQMLC